MAGQSAIEWTDATWNPVRGCTRVSPGCGGPGPHGGCYAEAIAARFSGPGKPYHGLAEMRDGKPRWTGRLSFGHDLDAPLSWRKPQRIFANSMSDLFHEGLGTEEIATAFGVAIAAHHLRGHTLQILTKRSARMREVLNDERFWEQANAEAGMHVMERTDPLDRRSTDARATLEEYGPDAPPPGLWIGVSAEDQKWADERRPDLAVLAAQGWITFASYEPALEPVDWSGWDFLSQLISGGESGPRARATHPAWHRAARDFCDAHGIAYFFKQWGEWQPREWCRDGGTHAMRAHGGQISFQAIQSHPNSIERVGAGPEWQAFARVGKKAAGRLLDGREHNGMPEARRAA